MVALRILAGALFLFAAIALVSDATRYLQGGGLSATSLAVLWRNASPVSLASTQTGISRLHPLLWDPLVWRALLLPAWLTLGILGLLVARIGRRRRRVNIFVN
jgi:hypothetical protein